MKISKIFAMAAAGLMLAGCAAEDPNINGSDQGTFEGDGYLAISINLPTTAGTRALNDDFDDGSSNEYYVEDGLLVLFKGSDEANAKCVAAYDLGTIASTDVVMDGPSTTDNITSRFTKAVKVENVNLGTNEKLYALVMINYKDVATVFDRALVVNGAEFNGTFTQLLEKKSSHPLYRKVNGKDTYFFMTNTPIALSKGTSVVPANTDVVTLTELTGTLKETEEEARKAVNGDIYVERAVAKATLSAPASAEIGGETLQISKIEWVIANDEAESYVVRNLTIAGDPTDEALKKIGVTDLGYLAWTSQYKDCYRFIGEQQIDSKGYRPYWAIDPKYKDDKVYKDITPEEITATTSDALYCHENTFDVAHQNYKNTTRAVLKVTYAGGDFWTLNGDNKKAFHSLSDAESHVIDYIVLDAGLQNAVNTALNAGVKDFDIAANLTITWKDDAESGLHQVASIGFKPSPDYKTTPSYDATALIAAANALYSIVKYAGGVSYYDLRFKHFAGQGATDLAPWSAFHNSTPSVNESYGHEEKSLTNQSEKDYLGRYGMVRNNWYDVQVTDINTLGSPKIPNANTGTPDDNTDTEQWLSFRINILSWAKRVQSVVL